MLQRIELCEKNILLTIIRIKAYKGTFTTTGVEKDRNHDIIAAFIRESWILYRIPSIPQNIVLLFQGWTLSGVRSLLTILFPRTHDQENPIKSNIELANWFVDSKWTGRRTVCLVKPLDSVLNCLCDAACQFCWCLDLIKTLSGMILEIQ